MRGNKRIDLIQNASGRWITTGMAKGWPRCKRCRRPHDDSPFDSGFCSICYFYKVLNDTDKFWQLHNSGFWFAPYNIGRRCTDNLDTLSDLNDRGINWRSRLKAQLQ